MAGKIFINYRRGDDPQAAGRLFDRLQDAFKPEQLFLDVDNIAPGLDFVRVLDEHVAECDVVLAVIGKSWLDARNQRGARRLDDPDDFVRIEITSALDRDKRVVPVLIGEAQMPRIEDLPEALRPLARRNAVRLTHERFRADTQGLIKSLQQALDEIEAERQVQAEATRLAQVETDRARREAERERQEAVAKQRAMEEHEFAAAKTAGTSLALDAFLAVRPTSVFADEAKKLRAALSARDDAYQRALTSDDPVLLKSFLATYRKGADADRIRIRLRSLEPLKIALPVPAIAGAAALAILAAGGAYFWVTDRSAPSRPPAAAVPAAKPLPKASPAQPSAAPVARPLTAPAPAQAAIGPVPASPAAPNPDQLAWSFIKDTTDEGELRRFVTEFPNSALRKDAASRLAALEAVETAWINVKDSKDPAQLRGFVEQYPDSVQRADAEQRIAALTAAPAAPAATNEPDAHDLARSLQLELKRVGCFAGAVNGEFDDDTRTAWHRFTKLTSLRLPDAATPDTINAVRAITKRVCPPICRLGEHPEGNNCAADELPPKRAARAKIREREQIRPAPASAPAPTSNTGCVISDRNAFNGVSGPPGCRP